MTSFRTLTHDQLYLALLTKEKIKPLSRWEGNFSKKQIRALKYFGLKTRLVRRFPANRKAVYEVIFSLNPEYLLEYLNAFQDTKLENTRQNIIREGTLFGYPECCVKNFADNGYTKNQLTIEEQKILFHWACPGCKITPLLLPEYQRIYKQASDLCKTPHYYSKKVMAAFSLSAVFTLLSGSGNIQNNHVLPVNDDISNSHLTLTESVLLGHLTEIENEAPAYNEPCRYRRIIDSLPVINDQEQIPDNSCYVIEHLMRGNIECPICAELINMGYIKLINPMDHLIMEIPYIALHFMHYNSFSYGDSINSQRVDIPLLKRILAPLDTSHLSIKTAYDNDNDGLTDSTEIYWNFNNNITDSNDNELDDGAEAADSLIRRISSLPLADNTKNLPEEEPYICYHLTYGVETCNICGAILNMGYIEITNPLINEQITFPIIGLHYLAHGRFSYSGTSNQGQIDILQLIRVLGTQLTPLKIQHIKQTAHSQFSVYPTPFHESTTISFNTTTSSHVKLTIYNILGEEVKILFDGDRQAGAYEFVWDGTDENGHPMPAGIYLCNLEILEPGYSNADKYTQKLLETRRTMLIR